MSGQEDITVVYKVPTELVERLAGALWLLNQRREETDLGWELWEDEAYAVFDAAQALVEQARSDYVFTKREGPEGPPRTTDETSA